MKVDFEKLSLHCSTPMPQPEWYRQVPRWYQLDPYAYVLSELLYRKPLDFEYLILASPFGSNETDFQFVATGADRAQKFVHTLPNIRASMALQTLNRVCQFTCIQNSPRTIASGISEFLASAQEGRQVALASVFPTADDSSLQKPKSYTALLLAKNDKGGWELQAGDSQAPPLLDELGIQMFSQDSDHYLMGAIKLRKVDN